MDIAPLYELKTRLRAAAIAGTSLLSEDFRLKKAAENFKPLESASPVFKKISKQTAALLSDNCPDKSETLLDVITLTDSVICTLGATEVSGELSDLPITETSAVIVNAPYSRLSAIMNALTGTGSGQYNAFMEIKNKSPELFGDYRVKSTLVKGLGAPYSELADEIGKTILGLGKEMLPLLKNDFDPKGKREMLRRVTIIERLGGAKENSFYLEQLENSEKDIRRALIYALRHDENNFDKLVELSKTEKGKLKTAALSAMLFFDRKEVAEYFKEMAKKKPDEVLKLMLDTSSDWSSELTARLIDELLVDDKGNKVTLSKLAEGKTRLKSKLDAWDMVLALRGKYGESIENIYREFSFKEGVIVPDEVLGNSILTTGNEGLKKLAIELNTKSKMKGRYTYAEAIVRLLGKEDCSKWIAEQVHAIYKRENINSRGLGNSPVIRAMQNIRLENGEYALCIKKFDEILSEWYLDQPKPIKQPIKGAITDIFIKYPAPQFDSMLADWVDPDDKEYRQKIMDTLINHAISKTFLQSTVSLTYLNKFGAVNIKGLALKYCQYHSNEHIWQSLRVFFNALPGDHEYKLAEAREIVELMQSGKLKVKMTEDEIRQFSEWVEERFK